MRSVSAPLEGSGASTMRRYKPAMVLCRASETTSASARRNTCCHCGLLRRKCKPYTKATSVGECCTMSLSKGISFLVYAVGWHSVSDHRGSNSQVIDFERMAIHPIFMANTESTE